MLNRYNGNLLPFANSADSTKRYVFGGNTPSDNIDDNINANFLTGWEIVGLNEAPPKQWFNALGYTSTYLASYLYQVGIPEYNENQEYYKNSVVNKDGIISVSKEGIDGTPNVGNDPATDKANWKTLATHTVDTPTDLRALDSIPDTVWVSGYHSKGDGAFGSNIFEWDSNSTEADNGGTIIKLDSVATGRYKLRYDGAVNVKWFGAKGDGVADDSEAIQSAINAGDIIVTTGVYICRNIALTSDLTMGSGAIFVFNGTNSDYLIDVSGFNIKVNILRCGGANLEPSSLVKITGDRVEIGSIYIKDVQAGATVSDVTGLTIIGSKCNIDKVSVDNFNNTGATNGSMPQAVLFTNGSTGSYIDTIDVQDGASGVVNFGDADSKIGTLTADNLTDNSIYLLNGTLTIGTVIMNNCEELVVTDGIFNCGDIIARGTMNKVLAFENPIKVNVGSIVLENLTCGGVLSNRVGSVSCGNVTIGSISGELISADNFIRLEEGTIEYLTIGELKVVLHLKAIYSGIYPFGSFISFTSCKGWDIRDWKLTIIDDDDNYSSTIISAIYYGATNHSKPSYFYNHNVICLDSSGSLSTMAYRGSGAGLSDKINFTGCKLWGNIGPYMTDSDFASNLESRNLVNTKPAVGTWRQGDLLYSFNPLAGGSIGWVCTSSGSPGTWKEFGTIEA